MLVTGSAKLDSYRKMGDSLAGRFFQYRLHPLDLKEIHYLEDCYGENRQLYYLRNKDGKEVDFCIASNQEPVLLVEVRWGDDNVSPHFKIFQKNFPAVKMIQVVKNLKREKTYPNGVEIRSAHRW